MNGPSVALRDVLNPAGAPCAVDPNERYALLGVRLAGRGAFVREVKSGSESAASRLTRVAEGDFVYSRLFAWQGAFGLIDRGLAGAYVSGEFPVYRADPARLNSRYLLYWFRLPSTMKLVERDCTGTTTLTRNRFKEQFFEALQIPLPPLEVQERIVQRLDAAAEKVGRAARLIPEIDDDLLQAARNIIRRAGERPEAWRACGSFMQQQKLSISVEQDIQYQFAGVYSFGRGVFKSDAKFGSEFKYTQLSRIAAGDFLYPKLMAWEGALGVVPAECDGMVVSPEFPVFQIDKEIVHPDVVDTYFRDPRTLPALKDASTGTNMRRRRIQPSRFLGLGMPIPTADEQCMVSKLLERRQVIVGRHRSNLRELDLVLPSMLHEAFAA